MHEEGLGAPQNYAEAVKWYRLAVETTYTILAGIATRKGNRKRLPSIAAWRVIQNGPSPERLMKCANTCRLFWQPAKPSRTPEKAAEFNSALSAMEEHGWANLVGAIRRILAGERNRDALCDKLDLEDSMIVETILEALENPAILQEMLPADMEASA